MLHRLHGLGVRIYVSRAKLITRRALRTFAELVQAYRQRTFRLWLISPWISFEDENQDSLIVLIDALRDRNCPVVLITRPPASEWHRKAVQLLQENTKLTAFSCPSLHTKLYIAECDGFRAALLGSANLTTRGDRFNREIAIELRTTIENPRGDPIASLINELTEYASSLREEDDVDLL